MARKPRISQGAASPSPGNGAIKMVKDRVGDGVPGISDGLGGVHYVGDVVELPREVCDLFIAKGFAEPADETTYSEAKARAAEVEAAARQAQNKSSAQARLMTFDDAPPELRALAREHGDEVIEEWLSGTDLDDILKAYGS